MALQYRIGNSGDFINVPTAFVADASGGPSQATLVTAVSNISLPEWRNQANLQLRIITTNAGGNDEWIGVDDIQVTSTALAAPSFGLDNYAFSVSENSANGASVGAVAATDSSAGETLTYSIASGNESGAFAIDASTGQITIAGGTQLNFEATPQIVLSLVVTDGTGQWLRIIM